MTVVQVVELEQIRRAVDPRDARAALRQGFVAFSAGAVQMPAVGELRFEAPPGEVHVKLGHKTGDAHFVIKVASGFYDNARHGLPNQDGALLVHERDTGRLAAVLLDRGWLTDLRTALAGALVAELLAPPRVDRIGVVGTGVQAQAQVEQLADVLQCRSLTVWGRRHAHAQQFARRFAARGYEARAATDSAELTDCQLVITASAATAPVLQRVAPGTHVTAVGCDSPHKHEVAPAVFAAAELVVADSRAQCLARGDLRHAVAAGAIRTEQVVELGTLLADPPARRADAITLADLTGLAVQDICIAQHVLKRLS